MSIEFNIDASYRWHMLERKEFDIRVLDSDGEPVDLSERELRWIVARTAFDRYPYLSLTTAEARVVAVAHEDDDHGVQSVAHIGPLEPEDYEAIPRHGRYRHELKDLSDDLVLSEGFAVLLPAMNLKVVS